MKENYLYGIKLIADSVLDIKKVKNSLDVDNYLYLIKAPNIRYARAAFIKVAGGCVYNIEFVQIAESAGKILLWEFADPFIFCGMLNKELVQIHNRFYAEFAITIGSCLSNVYFYAHAIDRRYVRVRKFDLSSIEDINIMEQ